MIPDDIARVIRTGFASGTVVVLTGAGISAESGIPVFRGKGGLWETYDPAIYANPEGLRRLIACSAGKLVDFMVDFYGVLCKASPNPAHTALVALERQHRLSAVITQNIDNLHQQAGSRTVIELHGNAYRIRCISCARELTYERDRLREMVVLLKKSRESKQRIYRVLSRYFPRCDCGGRFRIDVVFFGEPLAPRILESAHKFLSACSVLLIIGSSLNVYPAASLPGYARQNGATLVEINDEPSALAALCDYRLPGKASQILLELAQL
jgi:NAD-dependent deacetylase